MGCRLPRFNYSHQFILKEKNEMLDVQTGEKNTFVRKGNSLTLGNRKYEIVILNTDSLVLKPERLLNRPTFYVFKRMLD